MKKNSLFIAVCTLLVSAMSFGQGPKFYLDFEGSNPLSNLPSGVTNVNSVNTVRVKNTTNYPASPNVVQPDSSGGKELFLDFQGHLKVNLSNPGNGFTLAYDYRRNNANDDWWLGFLTFIGNDGTSNKLERIQIREWSGQLNFANTDSFNPYPIWFDTDYKIVITCSTSGDINLYVDNVLKLSVPNATSGLNLHTWTNTSLLVNFKGDSFDGTNVTPENEYTTNARDSRVFVDNVALFERELTPSEVSYINTNGNNTNPTPSLVQGAKYYLDFENANPLANLPSGVANVNATNTIKIKNDDAKVYSPIPNAVQSKSAGGNELFLDFHGYLKTDIPDPSKGFTLAYDYRRTWDNDDWWLGFLTFIGNDGSTNRLEQLLIKEWSGQLTFNGSDSFNPYPVWFDTNYKIVITCNTSGDIKVYVDNVLKLVAPNAVSGKNIHTWNNASLLLSFKGSSFDGTTVTPEPGYSTYSGDTRAYIDNVALFEMELSAADVAELYNNGNNAFGVISQIPTTAISFCKGSTVAAAVGTKSLKFYSALTGGTALASTSSLASRTYFVTETVNSVESTPRVPVVVTINALPTQAIGAITSNTAGTTAGTFAAATAAVGPFVGTTTTVSYRVPAFTSSDAYFWTVPAGVRIVGQAEGVRTVTQTGANGNVLNVNYSGIAAGIGAVGAITVQAQNANGCNGTAKSITLTKALPLAPSAITMHDLSLPLPTSGIPTAVRSFAKYMGTNAVLRLTATPSVAATSYEWNLPAGVNQLSGGTTNVITVNFAGVTSANTDNFTTTAGVSTNVLRIGVKAVNGVGVSTVSNSALVNPTTTSTARLLTLTAVAPAAPTLKMFDMAVSSTVAVTDISRYIGTSTPLTLVGTVAATTLASSFSWELAEGVNVVSGSVLSSSTIIVNFEDVAPGTASLHVGIKAVNGMGSSVKSNTTATPATSSTATLLKLSAGLPSAAGAVVGSLAICSNRASSVTYTITAAAGKANVYRIISPVGTTITGGTGNTRTITAVAGATFTVNYPSGFTSVRPAQRSISIQSVNGFGVSVPKLLTLTSNACTTTARTAKMAPIAQEFKVIAYPNPSSGVFNLAIESSNKAATTIQVYDMQGRMIESKQVNTNTVEIGANYTSGIYNVILENAGQAKTIRLIKK